MTEINKCNENRKEDKQKLTKLPVNKYLELLSSISTLKSELEDARREYEIEAVLKHFSQIIGESCAGNPESPLHSDWELLMGLAQKLKTYDITRSALNDALDNFAVKVQAVWEAERDSKIQANKLKTLLKKLYEHADEISKVVDLSEIFND